MHLCKMMIPNELENMNIRTYLVCWYDGDEWEAILAGMLTLPADPDFWDDQTGDISAALEAALPLYDANVGVAERDIGMTGCLSIFGGQQLSESQEITLMAGANVVYEVPAEQVWYVSEIQIVTPGPNFWDTIVVGVSKPAAFFRFIVETTLNTALFRFPGVYLTGGDEILVSFTGDLNTVIRMDVLGWRYDV